MDISKVEVKKTEKSMRELRDEELRSREIAVIVSGSIAAITAVFAVKNLADYVKSLTYWKDIELFAPQILND